MKQQALERRWRHVLDAGQTRVIVMEAASGRQPRGERLRQNIVVNLRVQVIDCGKQIVATRAWRLGASGKTEEQARGLRILPGDGGNIDQRFCLLLSHGLGDDDLCLRTRKRQVLAVRTRCPMAATATNAATQKTHSPASRRIKPSTRPTSPCPPVLGARPGRPACGRRRLPPASSAPLRPVLPAHDRRRPRGASLAARLGTGPSQGPSWKIPPTGAALRRRKCARRRSPAARVISPGSG